MPYRIEEKVVWDTKKLVRATSDFFDSFRREMSSLDEVFWGERIRAAIAKTAKGQIPSPVVFSGHGFRVEYYGPRSSLIIAEDFGSRVVSLSSRFVIRDRTKGVLSDGARLEFYSTIRGVSQDEVFEKLGLSFRERPFSFIFPKEIYAKNIWYSIVPCMKLVSNQPPLVRPGEEFPKLRGLEDG